MARLAIRMPKMSMTMTEGEVAGWNAKIGDEVAVGDVVCEVMTDKVDMEVESTVAGTLVEIVVESGMVDVGAPIAWVEGEDDGGGFGDLLAAPEHEDAQPDGRADRPAAAEPIRRDHPTGSPGRCPPSPAPAAWRASTASTSPRSRRPGPTDWCASPTSSASSHRLLRPPPDAPAPRTAEDEKALKRRTAVRRAVARVMVPTATIPQFTVWREVHLDTANARRDGLSWTTVLLRAYAAALRQVPELLSRWEDDAPTTAGPPSIALAVATERGLLVPTFVEPDLGDAREKDAEVREVVRAAQSGKVDGAYMAVANGSLSNLGGAGIDRFQALLTPPQASVLSLGSIRQRPVAVPGGLGLALTVEAGLTVDHRVADGAHGADLLARFVEHLDGPAG